MKKISSIIAIVLILLLALTSIAGAQSEKLRIALILPGQADDMSFNQAMYDAMMQVAEEMKDKIEVTVVERVYEVADIEPTLMDFASQGYDIIFGHGFQFQEPLIAVAEQFPETAFCLGTGYLTLMNTAIYDVELDTGGYLMGVLAGSLSESGKIGVIGGANVSEIFRGHEGYKFGAQSVNPDIKIEEVYTGDWNDSAAAKEAAISMYDNGVDVIWHSGDGIGLGVVEAAKEKNKYVLGNVSDMHTLAPENVVSGVVYQWAPIIKNIIADVESGKFFETENLFYWINIPNDGLTYAPYYELESVIPQEVKDKVAQVYQDLYDKKIVMPDFETKE